MSTKTTTPEEEKVTGLKNERKAAKDNKLAYYQTQYDDLDASKKRQQEMASITLDKLQKYLPYQLKAQGLSNTGASESTLLQAHNNYMNTMADISANYNSQKNELERYKLDDLAAIDEKYDAKMDAASFENYTLFEEHVQDLLGKYADENGNLSSAERSEIKEYINSKSDMLTDTDKARLMSTLDGYLAADETEQAAIDALQRRSDNKANTVSLTDGTNFANSGYGDDFKVSIGEGENKVDYKVEKGNIVSDEDAQKITESFGGTPFEGSSVVYNGKLYMYLYNNDTKKTGWTVIQQRGNGNSEFRDLCKALGIEAYSRDTHVYDARTDGKIM